jgi:hypothetical protein
MVLTVESRRRLDGLAGRLESVAAPSAPVFASVVATSTGLPTFVKREVDRLVEARAFTEAAFALVAGDLPTWRVRRLVWDAGAWVCSLSRHPRLPEFLDEAVDGRHEELPLAILLGLLRARQRAAETPSCAGRRVPAIRRAGLEPVACENFG